MLSQEHLRLAREVHARVFRVFQYVEDKKNHGKLEHWPDTTMLQEALKSGVLRGDCDDFALACRHLLWEHEIPNRLVLCLTEEGEGHLVCEVQGWILDNRQTRVMPRDLLKYKWISISGYNVGDSWLEISNG